MFAYVIHLLLGDLLIMGSAHMFGVDLLALPWLLWLATVTLSLVLGFILVKITSQIKRKKKRDGSVLS